MTCRRKRVYGLQPERIILSPGPGRPEHAGILLDLCRTRQKKVPILGVCLGHQAICMAYGARIAHAREPVHGKQSMVQFDLSSPLFQGLSEFEKVARYHSLVADAASIPDCLSVIARTKEGEVMAVSHRDYPIYGLQFHPESIMTPGGREMIKNFLEK